MNNRNAKALRKAFKAKENPEGYRAFKKAVRHSDPAARKQALQVARKIVASNKPIHMVETSDARH